MTLTVDWVARNIIVPKTDLTLISGTLYEHDTDVFRMMLKSLEESTNGIVHPDIHDHNASYTVAGVTYAQKIEIINSFSVEYEEGIYTVKLTGSNNNIFDVQNAILVQNTVQVIPGNAAGLVVVTSGLEVTAQDKTDIINGTKIAILGAESYP